MLDVRTHNYTAAVKGHLTLSPSDVLKLQTYCDKFLYVSSTGPILKRLTSQLKYTLFRGHGNRTVSIDRLINITNRRGKDHIENQESFLEKYPYHVNDTVTKEEDHLIPHYIIRQENLEEDLVPLMRSLNCSNTGDIQTRNVHSLSVNMTKLASVLMDSSLKNVSSMQVKSSAVGESELNVSAVFDAIEANISKYLRENDFRYRHMLQLAELNNPSGLTHAAEF